MRLLDRSPLARTACRLARRGGGGRAVLKQPAGDVGEECPDGCEVVVGRRLAVAIVRDEVSCVRAGHGFMVRDERCRVIGMDIGAREQGGIGLVDEDPKPGELPNLRPQGSVLRRNADAIVLHLEQRHLPDPGRHAYDPELILDCRTSLGTLAAGNDAQRCATEYAHLAEGRVEGIGAAMYAGLTSDADQVRLHDLAKVRPYVANAPDLSKGR